jgi:hypothetical protein
MQTGVWDDVQPCYQLYIVKNNNIQAVFKINEFAVNSASKYLSSTKILNPVIVFCFIGNFFIAYNLGFIWLLAI